MIIEHSKAPIVLAKDFKRMQQKEIVTIRGFWDSQVIPIRQRIRENKYKQGDGSEGFTVIDRALNIAAWSTCYEYAPKNEYGCANSGLYAWDEEKSRQKATFTDLKEASLIVKDAARFLGASLVGIAEYDQKWVYSTWYDFSTKESIPAEFPFPVKSVIVIAVDTDYRGCLTSPSLISSAATGLGYSKMAETARKMATFIRMLGYNAIPSGNDTAISIPLAIQAGLGELGRNGMLITPEYGPRVRLLKVLTDMPLQPDKPITFGVSQFCMKCKKCAYSCPTGAIPLDSKPTMYGDSMSNCDGVLKWYTDPERCYKFWALNGAECSNCIACCPYNKWSSWHHGLTQRLKESIRDKPSVKKAEKNDSGIEKNTVPSEPGTSMADQSSKKREYNIVDYAICKAAAAISDYTAKDNCFVIHEQDLCEWSSKHNQSKMKFQDATQASYIVKRAAMFLGANLVGIADYDKRYMHSGLSFEPKSVIVMGFVMKDETRYINSSIIATASTGLGHSQMAGTEKKVATFIRELGFKAKPCGDETAPSIPLAIMAGLGECGRNGLLVTKEYGPRVQLCKIFTDLDLEPDIPIAFGLKDFCVSCAICSEVCPAHAISSSSNGSEFDKSVDTEKCYRYCVENNTKCYKCIISCPYNKYTSWADELTESMANLSMVSSKNKPEPALGFKKYIINENILKTWWKKE
ncbi:reductive dehalogenase [Desulfitobacterium sp. PCE1]|uniref:reductive dehalogenase n=1 Tax=Desulfitobacterium sp. PCE1 TaxID=146907 RepID=UPI00035EDA7F|nr:reductive dehalogenase [Desulfitobacterium sp. PCE1]